MTFYLGCDVSKTKIDVAAFGRHHGSVLWEDKISNEAVSLASFLPHHSWCYPDTHIKE